MAPLFSLIVPTRQRPALLRRFLDSVAATAEFPETVEVVLVVDADDRDSLAFSFDKLLLKRVVVPPGLSMGALNRAGDEAASGKYLMLLNDDVIVRTRGWDTQIRACFECCPDDILLVHVNDTLMQQALCTFPIVSRTFCTLAGGICPRDYVRYRIDDHIEDVFNLLGLLGAARTVYLPHVIFAHDNYQEKIAGLRQYFAEDSILALDAPTFDALLPARKALAVRLRACIESQASAALNKSMATGQGEVVCHAFAACGTQDFRGTERAAKACHPGYTFPLPGSLDETWRVRLEPVSDSFALRVPERLHVVTDISDGSLTSLRDAVRAGRPVAIQSPHHSPRRTLSERVKKLQECVRRSGYFGLARLLCQKATTRLIRPWPKKTRKIPLGEE